MKSLYLLIVILYFPLMISKSIAQSGFQRKMSYDKYIYDINDLEFSNENFNILYRYRECFTSQNEFECQSIGIVQLDSTYNISRIVKLFSSNPDTNIRGSKLSSLNSAEFIVAGCVFNQSYQPRAVVIKLDSLFYPTASKVFSFPGDSQFELMQIDSNSNIYLVTKRDTSTNSLFETTTICKLDSNLNLIWSKEYSTIYGPIIRDFRVTKNENIIAVGHYTDTAISKYVGIVSKLDATGGVLWTYSYNTDDNYNSSFWSMVENDGNIYCYGYLYDSVFAVTRPSLLKLDSLGNLVWCKSYSGIFGSFLSMIQTSDNGFLLSSHYIYGTGVACLIKVDSSGIIEWSKYYTNFSRNLNNIEGHSKGYFMTGIDITPGTFYDLYDLYFTRCDTFGNSGCDEYSFNVVSRNNTDVYRRNIPLNSTSSSANVSQIMTTSTTYMLQDSFVCSLTTTNKFDSERILNIYPNPSNGFIQIISNTVEQFDFKIYSLMGAKVGEFHSPGGDYLVKLSLPNGLYIYSIESSSSGQFQCGKLSIIN